MTFAMRTSETLTAVHRGDLNTFNRLALEYQDLAFTLAYYLLGDEQQAIELLQKAFLDAFRNLGSFRRGTFRAWLLGRVIYACLRPGTTLPTKSSIPGDDRFRAILSLPSSCRLAAILVDLLGMDYEEASQAAGCSPKAFSGRLSQARAALAAA